MICPVCGNEMSYLKANIDYVHKGYFLTSENQPYWYCEDCYQDYDDEEYTRTDNLIFEKLKNIIDKYRK